MVAPKLALLASLLLGLAEAQSLAKKTPEVHPKLHTYKCSKRGGCKKQNSYVVLDSSNHPIYQKKNPTLGCGNWGSAPNATVCPDAKTCAENCVIDGIKDYKALGVATKGDSLFLDMLSDKDGSVLSPRVYLLDSDEGHYEMLKLTGKEFSFDVDISKLPCGMNGALYLSEMQKSGGKNSLNKAGAAYGTGYCDAQCFTFPFVNGVGNIEGKGACCPELDIWEANSRSSSIAPHPCNITGLYQCTGEECAWSGVCDEWGCVLNSYGTGNKDFYGTGKHFGVDTTRPFTVVTQFPDDANGKLEAINRFYIQDGKKFEQPNHNQTHLPNDINYMTDDYCLATGGAERFLDLGGLEEMGNAMSRGMVLAMSIWWDEGGFMRWLDSGNTGPCNATEGAPAVIRQIQPDTAIVYSKIKWGEIGSTNPLKGGHY